MTQAAPFRQTFELATRRLGVLQRELRDADQALGLLAAQKSISQSL